MARKRFWLENFAWLYGIRQSSTGIGAILIFFSVVEHIWTLFEASGRPGSNILLLMLLGTGLLVLGLIFILSRPLRWPLLHIALRSYIRTHLVRDLTPDKLLIGIGPGGAIATGMVAKVVRELGYAPPKILVLDMVYADRGVDPVIGSLWTALPTLDPSRCWIVQGNVNSGRSLRALREKYGLSTAPVFAFVISEAAALREGVDHYMAVGSRELLPWPTEEPIL